MSCCCLISTMPIANHGRRCVRASVRLYKGLMLRADDAQRSFEL